ncbi:CPBP family intramembrane glutamic endopeptidase [Saccharopolyspora sp. ID03-671]|uniref:CPBP family intramembrane glutamic endopeptidase n=1 Tax=Saccharopolyspora sp. ID03-671 TaxID=3073066 RepID=UPI00324CBCC2
MSILRAWLSPTRPDEPQEFTDPAERKAIRIELLVVFAVTLGMSGLQSLISLLDALLQPMPLAQQQVAINQPRADLGLLDMLAQLVNVLRLISWGALGAFLLWRSGIALRKVGLDRTRLGNDALRGAGLAALIGIPGLGLYLLAHALGLSLTVQPSTLTDAWWRAPVLVLSAFGNAFAEEVLVVGYVLTRLRQLSWGENRSLWLAAVLRGSYHLYQGFGGFVGNVVMGLVYGRIWQRSNRLVPLVIGHALIDVVAFVGYAALRGRVGWLP